MKKILSILLLCFTSFIVSAQVYTPVIANYTISGKPIGYSQATPSDGRSMFYDASNFIYRPYRDTQEVITYLNLPKYRAGNAVYFVDSGGTLNPNGTYTNLHVTYWTFQDGVADVNLIKLNWNNNGGAGCPQCFQTTTQLTDSSFKLNRGNGTSDTVVVDVFNAVFIATANNFLTLTGTNVQAGGPLVKDTYANGGGHVFGITGNIFEMGQGAAISSAAVLIPGKDGNTFQVIGGAAINDITTSGVQGGTHVGFIFTGTPTLNNNVSGPAGSAPMLLAGNVNYTANTNDYIEFVYDGVNNVWHETARKLSGSGGVYTFSNGLTESPATQVKLGGTLTQNTTLAGNGFWTAISGGRFQTGQGIPIIAAGDLFVGNDGNMFQITGTTQINAIGTTNWQGGSEISFTFNSIVTLKNNTVGGINTAPMLLAGRVDYTSAVGDYIAFQYDAAGGFWYETNRKLAGSVSTITANNGLTLTGSNLQLGGSLVQNTTINEGAFRMIFTGANPTGSLIQVTQTDNGGGMNILNTGTANALNVTNTNNGFGLSVSQSGLGASSGIFVTASASLAPGITAISAYQGINASTTNVGGTNAAGIVGSSSGSGTPGVLSLVTLASTNTVVPTTILSRQTTGTAGNGIGGSLDFTTEADDAGIYLSNQIISSWVIAAHSTRTSQLSFTGVNSGATNVLATLDGTGNLTLNGTGNALTALSGGTGAFLIGANAGIVAESPIVGAQFENTSSSNNTATLALDLGRQGVSFNGAIGNGVMIQMSGKDNNTSNVVNAQIQSKFTDVTAGATKSSLNFYVNQGDGGSPVVSLQVIGLAPSSKTIAIFDIPAFANNAAALAGGLTIGMCYRNGDVLQIVH